MRKRSAIALGVAVAGVLALGAQGAAAATMARRSEPAPESSERL